MTDPADLVTLILTRDDVRRLMSVETCIEAVERGIPRSRPGGRSIPPGVLGAHVDGGGFHVKTAGLLGAERRARRCLPRRSTRTFPGIPTATACPPFRASIALFDADERPAARAARLDRDHEHAHRGGDGRRGEYLARADAATVTVCGCGEQGRSQLRALPCVRPVRRVTGVRRQRRTRRAVSRREMSRELDIDVAAVRELGDATRASRHLGDVHAVAAVVLGRDHVAPGRVHRGGRRRQSREAGDRAGAARARASSWPTCSISARRSAICTTRSTRA